MLGLICRDHDPHVDHALKYLRCGGAHRLPRPPAPRRGRHDRGAYFTEANVDRYLEAAAGAGIAELGRLRAHPPLHAGARDLAPSVLGRAGARTTSAPTASSSPPRRCGSGSRWTSSPAARTGSRPCSTRTSSTTWSARSTSCATRRVDRDVYDVWDAIGDPDRVWKLYFETLAEAARTGLYDILAHPDLVKVWGGERPLPERDPRFYYEPAVEAIAEVGDGGRGLDRRAGESRSGSCTRRTRSPRCAWTPARPSRSPRTPTCPRTSAATTIAPWRRCASWGVRRSASSRGASAGRLEPRRRMACGSGSATTATASPRAAGWCSAGSRSSTSAASRATPTPTSLTHAVIDALLGAGGLRRPRHALPARRGALARRGLARPAARSSLGMLPGRSSTSTRR